MIDRGLDRPFGVLLSDLPLDAHDGLATFRERLRGPHALQRHGTTGHQGFTDIVWLLPQLGADPAAFNVGGVDPQTAVGSERALMCHFFARYL